MSAGDEAIGPDEVKAARRAWRLAVQARDVEGVVDLYDPQGSRLLGTMDTGDTDRRQTTHRIRDYFTEFLNRDRIEVEFRRTVTDDDLEQLGPGFVAYSGYYDFRARQDGEERTIKATFTFVYRRRADGSLVIVSHNSGLTPEGAG